MVLFAGLSGVLLVRAREGADQVPGSRGKLRGRQGAKLRASTAAVVSSCAGWGHAAVGGDRAPDAECGGDSPALGGSAGGLPGLVCGDVRVFCDVSTVDRGASARRDAGWAGLT